MPYCYDIPDHPVIRNMERTGYPDGKIPFEPTCPICDCKCETIYTDSINETLGCDQCIEEDYDDNDLDNPCPICGQHPQFKLYKKNGAIIGCDQCVFADDAYEKLKPEI